MNSRVSSHRLELDDYLELDETLNSITFGLKGMMKGNAEFLKGVEKLKRQFRNLHEIVAKQLEDELASEESEEQEERGPRLQSLRDFLDESRINNEELIMRENSGNNKHYVVRDDATGQWPTSLMHMSPSVYAAREVGTNTSGRSHSTDQSKSSTRMGPRALLESLKEKRENLGKSKERVSAESTGSYDRKGQKVYRRFV